MSLFRVKNLLIKYSLIYQGVRGEIEQEYESLFKNIIYSNVERYYEVKQERIEATAPKKAKPALTA